MEIRRYRKGEEASLWSLLYNSVHFLCNKDYTQEQLEAWAPSRVDLSQWKQRLSQRNPFVMVDKGEIVGFAELESNGHIDCFYCSNGKHRSGIGTALLDEIENEASNMNIGRLYLEASITAKGFFERKGFREEKKQSVEIRGVELTNFVMSKMITNHGTT